MENFPDGMHLRLRNRRHGTYLHADEDGVSVSLSPHRASLNMAWQVHRVLHNGDSYVLLHSAAYGRYLALSPEQVSPAYVGRRAIQGVYEDPEQRDVLWVSVTVDEMVGDVLMFHPSNRLLRATPWNLPQDNLVYADIDNEGTMMHWEVEAIPPRPEPPVLPGVTQLPRGVVLWRMIVYVRADDHGNFDPLARSTHAFSGSSLYRLTGDLATQLREQFHRITLCVRAGSQGRLTSLVIDLPFNQNAMEIIVLTTMSPATSLLRHPNVDAL